MTSLTPTDTANRIRTLLVKDFKIDAERLTLDARLDDLGVDSLGLAELIFNVEDEFRLKLPNVMVQLSTLGDVVHYIDDARLAQRSEAADCSVLSGVQTAI